jgi:hypothetical protein
MIRVDSQTVRDRLWIFTVVAGTDAPYLAEGGITRPSRMTPAEGALYLGVPNLIMVRNKARPAPEEYDAYATAFRPLKRIVWSLTGSSGFTEEADVSRLVGLASRYDNIQGVFFDDMFSDHRPPALSADAVADIRGRLGEAGRPLQTWLTVYQRHLDRSLPEYQALFDVVTLWTWRSEHLIQLESNLNRLEDAWPHSRRLLGCYMYDFGNRTALPVERMRHQCELGLRWLKDGRICGMIFLGNAVADVGLEAVAWSRHWIAEVGDTLLPGALR